MPLLTPTGTAEKADYINAVFLPVHTYITFNLCIAKGRLGYHVENILVSLSKIRTLS